MVEHGLFPIRIHANLTPPQLLEHAVRRSEGVLTNCGAFAGAHGVEGAVSDIVPVDVEVPGCPPAPEVLIEALRGLTGR